MMFSFGFFVVRQLPRFLLLVLLTISLFLLSFLLLGSTSPSGVYYNAHLMEYSFNHTSTLYPRIQSSYAAMGLADVASLKVRAGYLGICTLVGTLTQCSPRANLTALEAYPGVTLFNQTSNSTEVNLVHLAALFSNKVVHPYILMATDILTACTFLFLCWALVPALPGNRLSKKALLVMTLVVALLWGLGGMSAHVASTSGTLMVEASSMGVVIGTKGSRASAMTWVAFGFLVAVAVGNIGMYIRELRLEVDMVNPKV